MVSRTEEGGGGRGDGSKGARGRSRTKEWHEVLIDEECG